MDLEAQRRRDAMDLVVRQEIASAYGGYDAASRAVELYRSQVLETARRNFGVVRQSYELGRVGLLDDRMNVVGIGDVRREYSVVRESRVERAFARLERLVSLDAVEQLAVQRGTIGAFQSRVEVASSVLQSTTENYRAAESRIRDADIASEVANLVRLQILQQAAMAILAQANQQPALALRLLRGG